MSKKRLITLKSVETQYYQEREALFQELQNLDRRTFLKISMAAMAAALAKGVEFNVHSFMPVRVANAAATENTGSGQEGFTFAYISDSHLYKRELNDRFVRQLLRAVDDVNHLDPQPDFVLYGGDLAQLGQPEELELGAQILKELKAPVRMMVGEHDWFLDMGEKWRELFGEPNYSFDHKGVHFVTLNSVLEEDFWTERNMTPMERMKTVAGLDNGLQSRFQVGASQRQWLQQDLESYANDTPVIVFSHSPLYKYYRPWNFWTEDAEEVQALLRRFDQVTVIHGHTHQLLTHRMGNIHFHGMLSTAWPWPYAPEGLPELTVQMNRADPFNPNDALGDGSVQVQSEGLVDKLYNLWNRNPVEVKSTYLVSNGTKAVPPKPNLVSY
ncbi:metallophosphoesterase [Nitrosococcus halophilus Nc 4]|uniref:Metallophosphoesterase n=1 Tax=Nitrosococcus halophilus (strain Nc4) TaxID=472759 RepID=D5C339_NITHN|nr:metallophosphoesterase [Nitrosococcus halophilus]ADE14931.1 metallophosphoesterase [Nitrosococcus halophilus Nc 4]